MNKDEIKNDVSRLRKLSPGSAENLESKVQGDKILTNAFRLMRDASILFDAGSYASTVALASVAIEEIGKYLLARWSESDPSFSYDKRKLHLMKQSAVSALFMADSARSECNTRGIKFQTLATAEDFAELIRAILAGMEREKSFAVATLGKAMEIVKWSGLYYDEQYAIKGIEPANITDAQARSVMELLSKAFMALADEKTVAIGRYTFPYLYKAPVR